MYLTKQEVADLLRVSVRTITSYMQQRVIPDPHRIGGILLWDEDELHRRIKYSSSNEFAPNLRSVKRGRPRKLKLT